MLTPVPKSDGRAAYDRRVANVDARIRRLAESWPSAWGGPWSRYRLDALLALPLAEKEAFLRRRTWWALIILGLVIGGLLLFRMTRDHAPRSAPAVTWQPAGVVKNITLHSTTFATESTVRTSTGVFQVRGGVSAAAGDAARIKRDPPVGALEIQVTSLCIESAIKTACYPLL